MVRFTKDQMQSIISAKYKTKYGKRQDRANWVADQIGVFATEFAIGLAIPGFVLKKGSIPLGIFLFPSSTATDEQEQQAYEEWLRKRKEEIDEDEIQLEEYLKKQRATPIPGLPEGPDSIRKPFNSAEQARSPLVLDLDGDGIETSSLEDGEFFDHDGIGFAELSSWAGADDGILFYDINNNGIIDSV